MVVLPGLALILFSFGAALQVKWIAVAVLFLLGAVGFAAVPGMQMRVLRFAHEAPTLASGVNISAFNLGNALGAYLGGVTIAADLGYASPSWVGGSLAVLAVLIMVGSARWEKKQLSDRPVEKLVPIG